MTGRYPQETLTDLRNPALITFIDFCRWASAAIVLVGHLRNPLFQGWANVSPEARGPLTTAWYFVTGLHAEAVIVFFVLSGYLVGGGAAAAYRAGAFSPADYFVNRSTRILLPFWPALLLTAALDWSGSTFLADAGLYSGRQPMLAEKIGGGALVDGLGWDVFALNLLLQQQIHGPTFGSNHPLWTISLEFWFYVVFGLTLVLLGRDLLWKRVAWGFGLVILVAWLKIDFFVAMGLWFVGVAVAFCPRIAERPILALLTFAILLIGVRLGQGATDKSDLLRLARNYTVAIAFAWLLMSVRHVGWEPPRAVVRLNAWAASFSYSLYLIHFPLMIFLLSALYATGLFPGVATGYQPNDPRGLLAYAIVIVAVYGIAWLFGLATEGQTGIVRRMAKRWLRAVSAPRRDGGSILKAAGSGADGRQP